MLTKGSAYNAFTKYGRSSTWCKAHALSFRAMSRAVSIRSQLKKYMQRFNLPLESCEGDAKRLAKCLVSGYWRNGARWNADGTYRSVRGNMVSFPCFVRRTFIVIQVGLARPSYVCAVHPKAEDRLGCIPRDGGNKEDTVRLNVFAVFVPL